MSYSSWTVGMRVAFIGGATHHRRLPFFGCYQSGTPLSVGAVYTITEIRVGRDALTGKEDVGIGISPDPDPGPGLYPARCFRPVQVRKTSIEIFQRMLTPHRERERA